MYKAGQPHSGLSIRVSYAKLAFHSDNSAEKVIFLMSFWFNRPHLLIRAARHYEGAEQVLRRRAVLTAREVRYFIYVTLRL